jgi:16S rRNA (guanine966-N2)-methyltransferase
VRVIAGSAKGRKLLSVPGEGTRPITGRVKEALFNILGPDLEGAVFLDLFGSAAAPSASCWWSAPTRRSRSFAATWS